ncbi:MAG TPA: enoyl-CoA hydratase/isomerase family protein, partial [Alphaproteobacteria bacterium]|nr:enoyl-CoA hydratase/isomerase family protein [Alphaproteobacteria bacterium]
MTNQLEITVEGRLGCITLARPEAINALSPEMIAGITERLTAWRGDPAVRAVLFEGRGEKGFCAGGDVRYVRDCIVAGRPAAADAYFAAEYRMNATIATYPKPVLAITDGIVMGGGIGIAGHASFRITSPAARYAMPEAAIGFVSDVGVNWILAKAPEHRALLFLLTGLPVSGADVLALGLADCCVAPGRIAELRAGIVAAVSTGDVEPALVALLQAASIQAGERDLAAIASRVQDTLALPTAGDIVEELTHEADEDPALAPLAAALATRSPTSLEAILQSHRAARRLSSVEAVLALDRRLASYMARHHDFSEGVRAQLVERPGHAPHRAAAQRRVTGEDRQ